MSLNSAKVGDFVVYRKPKYGTHPSHRAKDVRPSTHGDSYSYVIEKFWVVREVRDDGMLLLETRGGKSHLVNCDDANLRAVSLWDRLWNKKRFPQDIDS